MVSEIRRIGLDGRARPLDRPARYDLRPVSEGVVPAKNGLDRKAPRIENEIKTNTRARAVQALRDDSK
jgi:hypothetical protein